MSSNPLEVITYEDNIVFNYTLEDKEEQQSIEREVMVIWEESIEKFIEEFGEEREYEVHKFKLPRDKENFIEKIEDELEEIIDEVQDEIAAKTKFGFEFTGQLHNDD